MNPFFNLLMFKPCVCRLSLLTFAASIIIFSPGAAAQTFSTDNLVVEKVYTFATPPGARAAGGYLTITNNGTQDDTLIGGTSSFANLTQVHEMKMVDDIMKMRHLEHGLIVPAGETVELVPGGLHVMFMQLTQTLKDGESLGATLTFSNAGDLPVNFAVIDRRKQTSSDDMKHNQNHSGTKNSHKKTATDAGHGATKQGSDNHSNTHDNMTKTD